MQFKPVSIKSKYNPKPNKQENYIVKCHSHYIRTTVTATPFVVRHWVHKVRNRYRYHHRNGRLVVGLGVQWTPSKDSPAAATLQLCVGHDCLIFQLEHSDYSPLVLRRFLSDPAVILVGIRNHSDALLLRECGHELEVSRLFDLWDFACDLIGCSSRCMSMERLVFEVLGMSGVDKKEWVGRSDWGVDWLTKEQVMYACVDVFVAFLIAKDLTIWEFFDNNNDHDRRQSTYINYDDIYDDFLSIE